MKIKVRWLRDLEQSLRRGQVERVSMEDMGILQLIIDHFISRIIILGVQLARRANLQGAQ